MNGTPARTAAILGILGAAVLIVTSCAILPRESEERPAPKAPEEEPAEEETGKAEAPEEEQPPQELERGYTQNSVLRALVQLHQLIGGFEEFFRYREGHPSFEAYLETVFLLEDGPYLSGRGTTVEIYDEQGELRHRVTRAVLGEAEQGYWWAVRQLQDEREAYFEVRTGRYGLPREVRYRSPQSGEVVARRTAAAQWIERMIDERGEEALREELASRRSREMNSNLPMYYAGLVEEGRETAETGAGPFRAVLFRSPGGSEGISVWFSPDVVGNILKIVKPDGNVFAEIVERSAGFKRRFTSAGETAVTPPYMLEGGW